MTRSRGHWEWSTPVSCLFVYSSLIPCLQELGAFEVLWLSTQCQSGFSSCCLDSMSKTQLSSERWPARSGASHHAGLFFFFAGSLCAGRNLCQVLGQQHQRQQQHREPLSPHCVSHYKDAEFLVVQEHQIDGWQDGSRMPHRDWSQALQSTAVASTWVLCQVDMSWVKILQGGRQQGSCQQHI